MADKTSLLQSYLSCQVCTETLKDPVSLSCYHSFCSSCLQKVWVEDDNRNCPICKRKSCVEKLMVNLTLKEVTDSFAGRGKPGTSEKKSEEKEDFMCVKHPKASSWICEDEGRHVCPDCEFFLHHSHEMVPTQQAFIDMKNQLIFALHDLKGKMDKYKKVEKTYNDVVEHNKKQLSFTEKQIRAEFNRLHQFLKEEEESRLAALREEEEQKGKIISREMKMIQDQTSSLSDSISAVEEELQKDNVAFNSKATQTVARVQCSVSDPQLVSGALIDVAKHLGNLSFRIWDKMKDTVHYSPVILDPNTAYPHHYVSDDLTSAMCGDTRQQIPDNPERFSNSVLLQAAEGFSSGIHSWDVEVGDHPSWAIGVIKESINRKGFFTASPRDGLWCLTHFSGIYTNGSDIPVTEKRSLQRIRVRLDHDRGELSFYDPEDMTHIYTHSDTFTEKLFPYFSIRLANDAKTADIKICPADFSVVFSQIS